jgi:Xaa-Pro aminopeptidase
MVERGLEGLLIFRQETMYYLTGYDTFGYVFFQCLYLGADGTMTLLTRAPDLRQARHTSVIEDIRLWVDGDAADPAVRLRDTWSSTDAAAGASASNGRRTASPPATAFGWRRRSRGSVRPPTHPTWSAG